MSICVTVNLKNESDASQALLNAMDKSGRFFYIIRLPLGLGKDTVEKIEEAMRKVAGDISFLFLPAEFIQGIDELGVDQTTDFRDSLNKLLSDVIEILRKYGPTADAPPILAENQP